MSREKRISYRPVIIGLVLIASIGMALSLRTPSSYQATPSDLQGVLRPAPKALQAFSLTGHDGRPLTLESLKGKWSMLFFGYTYCPDICPTALAMLSAMYQRLEQYPEVISDTRVIFISVDPQRDRPEKLAKYVTYFDKRFMAATGATEEIDRLARQTGAGYQIEPEDASGNYLISHTGSIFLVDPQARLVGAFPPPHDPETIISQYMEIRDL